MSIHSPKQQSSQPVGTIAQLPSLKYVPGGQLTHADAAIEEYAADPHGVHALDPDSE